MWRPEASCQIAHHTAFPWSLHVSPVKPCPGLQCQSRWVVWQVKAGLVQGAVHWKRTGAQETKWKLLLIRTHEATETYQETLSLDSVCMCGWTEVEAGWKLSKLDDELLQCKWRCFTLTHLAKQLIKLVMALSFLLYAIFSPWLASSHQH